MRCSHCRSLMYAAHSMRDRHTEQTWYECPTCGRIHLYSERLSIRGLFAANTTPARQGHRNAGGSAHSPLPGAA